jgi:hypothetical protein
MEHVGRSLTSAFRQAEPLSFEPDDAFNGDSRDCTD